MFFLEKITMKIAGSNLSGTRVLVCSSVLMCGSRTIAEVSPSGNSDHRRGVVRSYSFVFRLSFSNWVLNSEMPCISLRMPASPYRLTNDIGADLSVIPVILIGRNAGNVSGT